VLQRDELPGWLRLIETPGIGRSTARRLLAAFGSPQAIFDAPPASWRNVVGPAQADALAEPPAGFGKLLDATQAWLDGAADGQARAVITLGDPAYPDLLLQSADPPLLLYTIGRTALLDTRSLAIVGSRRPTPQGLEHARRFAREAGECGLTVVSGLALGIDGAAHEGALQAGAGTVAVVGTGLDVVYPARHRDLAARIAREGLLVSEFPIGTPSIGANFPQRNRIIAGLSLGTLVVEAALRSGSLITARLALESGRDVFAIPGSIHSEQSHGCHWLIKQGAKLVESIDEITEEFEFPAHRASTAPPAPTVSAPGAKAPEPAEPQAAAVGDDDRLLESIGHDPVSFDVLLARTGRSVSALGAALLDLELAGRVARLPGQLYQRIGYG
jgi:DNA processing protein